MPPDPAALRPAGFLAAGRWERICGGAAIRAAIAAPRRAQRGGRSSAVAERVSDRVDIADAEARDLPFPSASFDVVVSGLAISKSPALRGAGLGRFLLHGIDYRLGF
jgi:hypothetical protein